MTKADLIVEELIDVLDGKSDFDDVRSRYGDSRSVLYRAFTVALPIAATRFKPIKEELRAATIRRDDLDNEVEVTEGLLRERNTVL